MEDSKFNLWRACFSFCFVDGFLSKEEQVWVESKITSLTYSAEQKKILISDLKSPPKIDQLLPLITKPADRGFLLNNIRQLAALDKDVTSAEKEKISQVQMAVLAKLDLKKLNEIIAADEVASYHEDEVYKVDNKHSFIEKMVKGLMKIANPGDYVLPDDE